MMLRKSLEFDNRWDPRAPFSIPAFSWKFIRPDHSFSEQNSEEALQERAAKGNVVLFESEIGQKRFDFCLRTFEEERRQNPELVELVITSLLRATDCDMKTAIPRMQNYFEFYVEIFGALSFKQSLTNDSELREMVESGIVHVFENCDAKGRCMRVMQYNQIRTGLNSDALQIIKMCHYVTMRTLKNYPMTQKNGFIDVCDMGGLSLENFSLRITRSNLLMSSRFLPCKVHKICLLRPLYFMKFLLRAVKPYAFPGPMARHFLILSQDPKDLLKDPVSCRPEILPPLYGGTNTNYSWPMRVRGWTLEEEELEFSSEMGSSCRSESNLNDDNTNSSYNTGSETNNYTGFKGSSCESVGLFRRFL